MKTNSHTLIAGALLLLVTTFTACQKDNSIRPMSANVSDKSEMYQDPERGLTTLQGSEFEKELITRKWVVNVYNDGKVETRTDKTHFFDGFTFDFNEYHVVIANSKERNLVGKWNTYWDGSQQKLALSFGFTPCIMLNEEWLIKDYSSRSISLDCPKGQSKSVLVLHNSGNLPK